MRFLGVDLGWWGKPSGLASLELTARGIVQRNVDRLEGPEVLHWIAREAGPGDAVVAVDAPLVIPNASGTRACERDLNRDFRRFHAGCHAANLGRPFAAHVIGFSRALAGLGFAHNAAIPAKSRGRFQLEVHPHAAAVSMFGLDRIVKYKKGPRSARAGELERLRGLMATRLPALDPPFKPDLPSLPPTGNLKPAEDQIDAVLCAYIAAHWWTWGVARNRVYGCEADGYIVVPQPCSADASQCDLSVPV